MRKKSLKRIIISKGNNQSIQEKGNMDVEMTIDVLHHREKFDIAALFTGDSDFLAIEADIWGQTLKRRKRSD